MPMLAPGGAPVEIVNIYSYILVYIFPRILPPNMTGGRGADPEDLHPQKLVLILSDI